MEKQTNKQKTYNNNNIKHHKSCIAKTSSYSGALSRKAEHDQVSGHGCSQPWRL